MRKILIVDDDPRIREMYKEAFELSGYKVALRPDGENILNHIKQEKPDLVILDIMMPNIQGLDLLKIIKNNARTKNTKILIFSALSDESARKIAMKNGATLFLTKSEASISQVISEVDNILAK